MIFKGKNTKFFYLGSDLKLHEVNRLRVKLASIIGVCVTVVVAAIIVTNQFTVNFLGFGSGQANDLRRENDLLKKEIAGLNRTIGEFRTSLDELKAQGDELRLMVDLPPVDNSVKDAGRGGARVPELMSFDVTRDPEILDGAGELLTRLTDEVKVQQQNYAQILRKYETNKEFFAALPALKPMRGRYATNKYGMRMHPVLGVMKNHRGLDIAGDVGTEVFAAGDGVVSMAGRSGGGYGNIVVINHGYGYQTLYAHLSKVLVRSGKKVKRGDLIAKSGKTGLVSGPHLHYEVRRNGITQNPADYFFDDVDPATYVKHLAEGNPSSTSGERSSRSPEQ